MLAGAALLSAAAARADLQSRIDQILGDRLLAKASVGVMILALGEDAPEDRLLYRRNAEMPLIPASNMKLVTTSAALHRLGRDFRFRTLLLQKGQDLILLGDGDPSFGDAQMLRRVGWESRSVFRTWAEHLKKAGMAECRDVIVDDSVFDEVWVHPHWPADQQQSRYVPQVCGMGFNVNCLDFYVIPARPGAPVEYRLDPPTAYAQVQNACLSGAKQAVWLSRQPGTNRIVLRGTSSLRTAEPLSVTIHDPGLYAATVFSEVLVQTGIRVQGKVLRGRMFRPEIASRVLPADLKVLACHETPIDLVVTRANKDSMNLYAECLCKRLGAKADQSGSWAAGTAAMGQFLRDLGVPAEQFNLDDGCGLSRENRLSASAVVRVLSHNFHGLNGKVFMASLAVGGEDGTLDDRFRDPELRGRVLAKTGYVAGVSALSGYVRVGEERWYVFSILMNGLPPGSNSTAKKLQEALVKALYAEAAGGRR